MPVANARLRTYIEPLRNQHLQVSLGARQCHVKEPSFLVDLRLAPGGHVRWDAAVSRGIFTSPNDLDKKLMRYIRQYNKDPKPLKWKYADPTRRITADSSDSVA